jgi:hypothetical protein
VNALEDVFDGSDLEKLLRAVDLFVFLLASQPIVGLYFAAL